MRRALPFFLLLLVSACKPAEESHSNAIIGAVLIDGAGGPPVTDSAVVVSGDRIRAAGARSNVTIPADADKINGAGKYLVPALVDICERPDPPGSIRPTTADEARAAVADAAAHKVSVIHIAELPPPVAEAVMEAARGASIPVAAHISTQAAARLMVDRGASILIGMIADTEVLDSTLLSRLRDLRIVVAPALSQAGVKADIAARNTRRLFEAGVPIALASMGGDLIHEAELMVNAGVPPLDVIVAATTNSALALRQIGQRGTIEPGKRADLLLVTANPGEDVANLRKVALRMNGGEWIH